MGHTLVDASSRTASVLMVNPNAEEVVLPSFTCVGKLVPVSAISVALADPGLPIEDHAILPEHLENIVRGSHPSLGESGRQLLCDLLYRYRHVFLATGDPVTGRTTSVQHEILTPDARLVQLRSPLAGTGWPSDRAKVCSGYVTWRADRAQRQSVGFPSGFGDQEGWIDALLCRLPSVECADY